MIARTIIGAFLLATGAIAFSGEHLKESAIFSMRAKPSAFMEKAPAFNLAHLDSLGEQISGPDGPRRIVHIYSEAPDYEWVGDKDEGIACVDDAARAAVVYLRHFQTTGNKASRRKAESLLRFVMYMQADNGLFYNFVWDDSLHINKTHENSQAEAFEWWAARAVWALGMGARVLKDANPHLAEEAAHRVRRTYPYLEKMLSRYGEKKQVGQLTVPQWLVYKSGADATSELLLGLAALNNVDPSAHLQQMIDRFAEGLMMMQYGSMSTFPYGAHASSAKGWHGWGNAQTQALSELGLLKSARREAEDFYSHLLVEGWLRAFPLDGERSDAKRFSQIAYAVRCVSVGLIRLYESTGEPRYAKMAGIAASWFMGNNPAGIVMYDEEHGRGYDGILSPENINFNAGAESTIEALYTILEVRRHSVARRWMTAQAHATQQRKIHNARYVYRVFSIGKEPGQRRLALVMNLTEDRLRLLSGQKLIDFISR